MPKHNPKEKAKNVIARKQLAKSKAFTKTKRKMNKKK